MTTENTSGLEIKNTEEITTHPLLLKRIRPICNWSEWLEFWQKATTSDEMIQLLDIGLDKPLDRHNNDEQIDRIIFYLKIADGWTNHFNLRDFGEDNREYHMGWDENGNAIMKSRSELCQNIATKAFEMLCLKFFKLERVNCYHSKKPNEFFWSILDDENGKLFLAIMHFFRTEEKYGPGDENVYICNLNGHIEPEKENMATSFIIKLINFLLDWKEPLIASWKRDPEKIVLTEQNTRIRNIINNAKPQIVEILSSLNRLDILEKYILDFDDLILDKLKEISLRKELKSYSQPIKDTRKALDLEEACLAGSKTALLLLRYGISKKAHCKLIEIREAEIAKEIAEQELKELTSSTK
ncbi:MAG: hypothetical protein WC666_01435 [Candidatus Paceibacterota bacterium]|jgi:hypothetical protein